MDRAVPCIASAVFASVVAWSNPSSANDGFGALAAGGIVIGHTDEIAMAREVLEISERLVNVDYEFVNESDADITETISFPLPSYSANPPESGVIYQGTPLDFRIWANHKPVNFEPRVWIYLNGKDVTDRLSGLGLTAWQMALVPFERSVAETHQLARPPEVLAGLRTAGFVDNDNVPLWDVHVAYEWKQTFPARAVTRVQHSYRPMISSGTASGYAGPTNENTGDAWLRSSFCADEPALASLRRLHAVEDSLDSYELVPGAEVKYVLMTGNTWKDGIRDFTLRLRKSAPYEIVSLCFDAPFKRINGLTLEAHLNNFHPKSDLAIYFGNAWGSEMPSPKNPPVHGGLDLAH